MYVTICGRFCPMMVP
ncbi:MAG: hypothetical protein ACLTZM_23945 [Ruminococcus sp.]